MKISEKQIYELYHIVAHTRNVSTSFGGYGQSARQSLVQTILNQQSKEVVDTRDFELMKLASDENN